MTTPVEFSIWIASKSRWAHLTKTIPMPSVPRVGEFIIFTNEDMGPVQLKITQVTYHESASEIEAWTEFLDNIDDRGYSFETESEFDECFGSYISEGWQCERGVGPNTRYIARTAPAIESPDDLH